MNFIKRLFGLTPDVIIYHRDNELSTHRSYFINGRRFVDYCGTQAILLDDGTVIGRSWFKTWEAI